MEVSQTMQVPELTVFAELIFSHVYMTTTHQSLAKTNHLSYRYKYYNISKYIFI
jgi:hypothetical protein